MDCSSSDLLLNNVCDVTDNARDLPGISNLAVLPAVVCRRELRPRIVRVPQVVEPLEIRQAKVVQQQVGGVAGAKVGRRRKATNCASDTQKKQNKKQAAAPSTSLGLATCTARKVPLRDLFDGNGSLVKKTCRQLGVAVAESEEGWAVPSSSSSVPEPQRGIKRNPRGLEIRSTDGGGMVRAARKFAS